MGFINSSIWSITGHHKKAWLFSACPWHTSPAMKPQRFFFPLSELSWGLGVKLWDFSHRSTTCAEPLWYLPEQSHQNEWGPQLPSDVSAGFWLLVSTGKNNIVLRDKTLPTHSLHWQRFCVPHVSDGTSMYFCYCSVSMLSAKMLVSFLWLL